MGEDDHHVFGDTQQPQAAPRSRGETLCVPCAQRKSLGTGAGHVALQSEPGCLQCSVGQRPWAPEMSWRGHCDSRDGPAGGTSRGLSSVLLGIIR